MVVLRSALLAIGFPILILTGIALVLSKTAPHPAKNVEAYSVEEVEFLQEVSAAVAAERTKYTPFDCKLPKHELVRVGLTALRQKDGATEVTVPSLETTLFVYWLQMDEGKCNLVALASAPAETVPEGLFFTNKWNLGMNLATAFFDPDNDLMVQRLAIEPKDTKDTLEILRLFAGDVIDFRIALLELRKTDTAEVDQMTL